MQRISALSECATGAILKVPPIKLLSYCTVPSRFLGLDLWVHQKLWQHEKYFYGKMRNINATDT